MIDTNSPRLRQTADTPPATRAAAVPTSSSCCPASSLFDGPGIYGSARVPLSSALRAGGQQLALRNCARVHGLSTLLSLQERYPKRKKLVLDQWHPTLSPSLLKDKKKGEKEEKAPMCWINNKIPSFNSAVFFLQSYLLNAQIAILSSN